MSSIAKNTISNVVFTLTKGVSGLLMIPVFVSLIGKEDYGIVVLIMSIIGYTELFDVGLKMALVRNLTTEAHNEQSESQIFIAALAGSMVYFFVSALFLSAAIFLFGARLGLPVEEVQSPLLYGFALLFLLINIINPIFSALIISKNRLDLVNYRAAIFTVLGLGLTLIIVSITGWTYRGWMLAVLISKMLEFLVILKASLALYPKLSLRISLYSGERLRSLLSFGWKILVAKWNRKMKFDSDPIVISYFLGPAALALYRPGAAIVQSLRPLITSLSGQLYVTAASAEKNKDAKTMRMIFLTGSKFTLLAYLPVFFVLLFLGDFILTLWLGKAFNTEDLRLIYRTIICWSLIDFFFYMEGSSTSVLFGINKLNLMVRLDFLLGLINLTCSVLLLKYSDFGILSVMLPGVLIEFFSRSFFFINTANHIGISFFQCLKQYFFPLVLVFLLLAFPLSVVSTLSLSEWQKVLLDFCLIALIFPLATWRIALNQEEKSMILSKTASIRRIFSPR
jgi:membrane protein EpsK